MLLTVDVGNTQIALGMFEQDELIGHWRVSTDPVATLDEIRWEMTGILRQDGFAPEDIVGIAISSVVPAVTTKLRKITHYLTAGRSVVVEPGVR